MKRIEFKPRVGGYVANGFHFISNLACWHFSCRKFYNEFWLQKTGSLTQKEKEVLEIASVLFRKYSFGEKYWGKIFIRNSDDIVWQKAREFFGKDFVHFKQVFETFEPRFQKLWKDDQVQLENWAHRLNTIQFLLSPPGLIDDINYFFGSINNVLNMEVLLLINTPTNSASGSSVLGSRMVTLEISRTPFRFLRPVISVLWHETVHNIWQTDSYWKYLKKFLNKKSVAPPVEGVSLMELVNEAITESLFPHGYLANKYFGFPSQEYFEAELSSPEVNKKELKYWRDFSANKLFPIVRDYIEHKKHINEEFIFQGISSLNKCLVI